MSEQYNPSRLIPLDENHRGLYVYASLRNEETQKLQYPPHKGFVGAHDDKGQLHGISITPVGYGLQNLLAIRSSFENESVSFKIQSTKAGELELSNNEASRFIVEHLRPEVIDYLYFNSPNLLDPIQVLLQLDDCIEV